jgi:hypothetical protein
MSRRRNSQDDEIRRLEREVAQGGGLAAARALVRLYERRGDKVDLDPYREIGNNYVEAEDRFVVAFVDGYRGDRELGMRIDPPGSAEDALYRTLDQHLTGDSIWSVFDRRTGVLRMITMDEAYRRIEEAPETEAEILVEITASTGDFRHGVDFNAVPWLEQATDEEIVEFAQNRWVEVVRGREPGETFDTPAMIAIALRDARGHQGHYDDLNNLLDYAMRTGVRVEVHVDDDQALQWIRARRPSLEERL